MNNLLEKYLSYNYNKEEFKGYGGKSVHKNDPFRFDKAKEQAGKDTVSIELISTYINDFLEKIDIIKVKEPKFDLLKVKDKKIGYEKIKKENSLKSKKDIVWLKFTKDGYLGVVAGSNDVNFNIPKDKSQYNIKKKRKMGKIVGNGSIIHQE